MNGEQSKGLTSFCVKLQRNIIKKKLSALNLINSPAKKNTWKLMVENDRNEWIPTSFLLYDEWLLEVAKSSTVWVISSEILSPEMCIVSFRLQKTIETINDQFTAFSSSPENYVRRLKGAFHSKKSRKREEKLFEIMRFLQTTWKCRPDRNSESLWKRILNRTVRIAPA